MAKARPPIKSVALRPHQVDGALTYLRVLTDAERPRRAHVTSPTASGKTWMQLAAATLWLEDPGSKGVIAATPRENIEENFLIEEDILFAVGDQHALLTTAQIQQLRDADKVQPAFAEHLRGAPRNILLTSHATLVNRHEQGWWETSGRVDAQPLKGWLLMVDEVHHAGRDRTQLYDTIARWYELGGTIWTATATFYREDRAQVLIDGGYPSLTISRSQLAGIYLPEIVSFRVRELVDVARPRGELSDQDLEQIVAYTLQVGRPTIIRFANVGAEGSTKRRAGRLIDAFVRKGLPATRILNAVGEAAKDGLNRALKQIRAETAAGGCGYLGDQPRVDGTYQPQVIIDCARMVEGADWPVCGHVIMVGGSMSLQMVVQLLGRASRLKDAIAGYPAAWQNSVLMTMYVPNLSKSDPEEALDHTKRALILAGALECSPEVAAFNRIWASLVPNMRIPQRSERVRTEVTRLINGYDEDIELMPEMVGTKVYAKAAGQAALEGRVPTLRDAQIVMLPMCDGSVARANFVTTRLLAHGRTQDQAYLTRIRKVYNDAARHAETVAAAPTAPNLPPYIEAADIAAVYHQALHEGLQALAVERTHETLALPDTHRCFEATMDGAYLSKAAKDLATVERGALRLTDMDIVNAVIKPFFAEHQRYPTKQDYSFDLSLRYLPDLPKNIGDIDRYLQRSGFDLARLCVAHQLGYVLADPLDQQLLADQLPPRNIASLTSPEHWRSVQALRARGQQRAGRGDLLVVGNTTLSWFQAQLSAARGWRGLLPGTTIQDYMRDGRFAAR